VIRFGLYWNVLPEKFYFTICIKNSPKAPAFGVLREYKRLQGLGYTISVLRQDNNEVAVSM